MPYSPELVERERKRVRKKLRESVFVRIDAALVQGRTTFSIPDDIDHSFVDDVVTAYARAGWQIRTWNSDELNHQGPPNRVTMSVPSPETPTDGSDPTGS